MQERLWIGLALITGICATLLLAGCENDSSSSPDNSSPSEQDWGLYAGHWVGTGLVFGDQQRTITVDISSEDGTVMIDDSGGNIESLPWNDDHKWDFGSYKELTFTSPMEGWYTYGDDTIALHRE